MISKSGALLVKEYSWTRPSCRANSGFASYLPRLTATIVWPNKITGVVVCNGYKHTMQKEIELSLNLASTRLSSSGEGEIADILTDTGATIIGQHYENDTALLTIDTIIKYILSLALLIFSIVVTISLIFNKSTKLSNTSPWLALFVLCGTIVWLALMEGQQASLVGLTSVVDHLVYKGTHPIAYTNIQLAHRGNNLSRYVTGRQFMVVMCVFVINLCGAPASQPDSQDVFIFSLPNIIQEIFLGSGLYDTNDCHDQPVASSGECISLHD